MFNTRDTKMAKKNTLDNKYIQNDITDDSIITITTENSETHLSDHVKHNNKHRSRTIDWSTATKLQVRNARLARRYQHRPLEPELIAALKKYFPNYDAETDTLVQQKDNWSNKSDTTLRNALHARYKKGADIEPELSIELAKRFPGYNPTTKKFSKNGKEKITDFSHATPTQLRNCRAVRHAKHRPLEPELIAALQENFPNYDAATDTFIRDFRTRKKTLNFSTATPEQLRRARLARHASGKPLEPELIAALERNFPKYDASTDTLIRTTHGRAKLKFNSNTSKQTLYNAYRYRIRLHMPIEQSLNDALAARFPEYDPVTQTMQKKTKKSRQHVPEHTSTANERLFPLYSILSLNKNYALHFNNNKKNDCLLTSAAHPYEVCLIDQKTNLTIIRKIIDATKSALYVINYKNGKVITETKSGVSMISYSPETHEIYIRKHRDKEFPMWHISAHQNITSTSEIPDDLPRISASPAKPETILIDNGGNATTHSPLILGDFRTNDIQNKAITKMLQIAQKSGHTKQKKRKSARASTTQTKGRNTHSSAPNSILVSVDPVKTDLMGTYSNIYINGHKILSNHFDTEIKLLFDGTLLGIHGTVTDKDNLPTSPIWMIYDTTLRSRINLNVQTFGGYQIHAKDIKETSDGLQISLSNRSIALLKYERIVKQAGQKRFVLTNQKEK